MHGSILFVDDERAILKTLKRSFYGTGYRIFTAEGSEEALGILSQEKIDIIVSDMRMPQISGHQLLRRVRELYPSTIRVILSGHIEEAEVLQAILDGSCKTYLMKPWDSQSLIATFQRLLQVREKLNEKNLVTVVNEMDQLCVLPQVYSKLEALINQDAAISQIAAVIEEDPVLTAKILHCVNSVYFGIKTGSIQQAVGFLGLTAIKTLTITVHLCDLVKDVKTGIFSRENLWRHACLANKMVALLHKKLTGKKIPQTASAAGVLLGVGLMALLSHMPDKYAQISQRLQTEPDLLLDDLEREFIGTTHYDVGGYLIEWWGLPQPLVECVLFHHDPFNECVTDKQLVSIVHLANYYTLQILYPNNIEKIDERALNLFNITADECKKILTNEFSI